MPCACQRGVVRLAGLRLVRRLLPWSLLPSGGLCRDRQRDRHAGHMPIHSWGGSWGVEGRGRTPAGSLAGSGLGSTSFWLLSLCHRYPQVPPVAQPDDGGL